MTTRHRPSGRRAFLSDDDDFEEDEFTEEEDYEFLEAGPDDYVPIDARMRSSCTSFTYVGRMTVVEYRDKFLTLSRYAPDETDTVEKRKERFLNGLHDEMQTVLVNIPFTDLEALVDSAIQMEGKLNQANENRKCRMMNQSGSSHTQKLLSPEFDRVRAPEVPNSPAYAVDMVEDMYPGRCQPRYSFNINMVELGHRPGKGRDEGSCSHSEDKEEAVPRDRPRHWQNWVWDTSVKLEEVDIGPGDKPRPTFISKKLDPQLRGQMIALLKEYPDCFAWDYTEMPGLDRSIIEHRLPLKKGFRPFQQRARQMRAEILEEVKKEIEKMLAAGFIRPCRYAKWISSIVPVEKKDGRWRVAIDFRDLNRATPKDEYPMPVAETLINAAAGHKVLSFMDGNAGYNQIFMAPEDIHKTAFRVPGAVGLFEYVVMTFGLKNAGATYQRAMNYIFHDLIEIIVICKSDVVKHMLSAPVLKGRLGKWMFALSEFDLRYQPAKAVKGQALADLIAERISTNIAALSIRAWAMFFDGSACDDGCGIGILLVSPRRAEYSFSIRMIYTEEYAALMSDTIEDATELRLWSLEKIKENKARVARAYNKKVRPKEFQVGDLVWEVVLPLGTRDKAYGKWSPNWHGPYKVVQALKGNAYMLEELDGQKFPVAVNGQHLKKYFPSMWDDGQSMEADFNRP
ncbi:hypothetical protein QYE76_066191 [Lolium multiflorum]|uniref:Reverse transcriptase domain-containing protein n=1 Tax=Lolium multiflorum TaxID=4521 RepID=A0AAD8SBI8_LOLMU|nr:hypothetical protein QYE76_066191 [Lolium multiflorum]